jgi:hypothetical protein
MGKYTPNLHTAERDAELWDAAFGAGRGVEQRSEQE